MRTRNGSFAATASNRSYSRWIPPTAGATAGLALAAAFPPLDLGPLAFVALVPVFLVASTATARMTAVCCAVFGATFFGAMLSWIRLFGLPAHIGLVVLETGFVVAAVLAGAWLRHRAPRSVGWIAVPAAFVVGEYLRSVMPFGGFTWGGLGYSQHDHLHLLRLASFTGVWGVSFAVALVNSAIGELILERRNRTRWWLAAGSLALITLVPALIPRGSSEGPPMRVGMVQADAPEGTLDPAADDRTVFDNHVRLTKDLPPGVDLVIWPESAFDSDPMREPLYRDGLVRIIRTTRAPFLVGATRLEQEEPEIKLSNVSLFLDPQGRLKETYVKRHLVPFGEFVPARSLLEPVFDELRRVPYDFLPGGRQTVFKVRQGPFASVICFESTFPGLVRSFVQEGARFLVVSTNNSSFERTAASDQHVIFSQLRAAEHHMWVAHTALTGVSAVVAPDGRVTERTSLFEPAILSPLIRFAEGPTFYARYGDWFAWLTALVLLVLAGLSFQRRRGSTVPEGPTHPSGGTLVVVPTYNEANNIRNILRAIRSVLPGGDILVVDDDSPDGTAGIVQQFQEEDHGVHLLSRSGKQGLGRAYVAGFGWGLAREYDRFIEMDADFSHDPQDLSRLVESAEDADLVIGSRYVKGGKVSGWGRGRHALSKLGNLYARRVLGFNVRDSTSGFRCYRREVLDAIGLENILSDGYAFQIDMAYRAWLLGFEVREVPITFRERRSGESKMSRAIVAEAVALVTLWGLRDRLTGRRRKRQRSSERGPSERRT